MNKLKYYRENRNLTQNDLAHFTGLSLRTIQRIESGTSPKGHTLKVLLNTLEIGKNELLGSPSPEIEANDDMAILKLLNTSILSFIIIPFGNIIFPSFIYWKYRNRSFRKAAESIISFQILWTLLTSILLILSPFVQNEFSLTSSLILWVLVLCFLSNLLIIFINSYSLTKRNDIKISSPVQFF